MPENSSSLLAAALGGGGFVSLMTLVNNMRGTSVQNQVESLKSQIEGLKIHNGKLERELIEAQETIAIKIDPLYDAMDRIDRGKLSGRDAENFKEILHLLQKYRKISQKMIDCKVAGNYVSTKIISWSKEATQLLIKERPQQFSRRDRKQFLKEVSILLSWVASSLIGGGPSSEEVSVYGTIKQKVADSPEPYVRTLEYLKRKHDWAGLSNHQANYLERMLDIAIKKATDQF